VTVQVEERIDRKDESIRGSTGCVTNWQKFQPQNTKVARKKSQRPDKSAAEFSTNLASGRKVA
jgi:hypothetical protein